MIALFAPELPRWGFESLALRLENDDGVLIEEHFFDDSDAARAFLAGAVLEVGVLDERVREIHFPGPGVGVGLFPTAEEATLTLEVTTSRRGARFELGFLVGSAPLD